MNYSDCVFQLSVYHRLIESLSDERSSSGGKANLNYYYRTCFRFFLQAFNCVIMYVCVDHILRFNFVLGQLSTQNRNQILFDLVLYEE